MLIDEIFDDINDYGHFVDLECDHCAAKNNNYIHINNVNYIKFDSPIKENYSKKEPNMCYLCKYDPHLICINIACCVTASFLCFKLWFV
jgi:hypothetical protein